MVGVFQCLRRKINVPDMYHKCVLHVPEASECAVERNSKMKRMVDNEFCR